MSYANVNARIDMHDIEDDDLEREYQRRQKDRARVPDVPVMEMDEKIERLGVTADYLRAQGRKDLALFLDDLRNEFRAYGKRR